MPDNMYELTYILNPVLKDDQFTDLVERIKRFITENSGSIIEEEVWGLKRLTYPIQKKRNGYYVNLYFTAPGELIARLERNLQITDGVMRYLTLKYDAKMKRHFEKRHDAKAEPASADSEA